MKQVHVINHSRPLAQPLVADYCERFWCRLRGLAFRRSLATDAGLVLVLPRQSRGGAAIHMFGMLFDLSIVWADEQLRIVDVKAAKRWRSIVQPASPARYVIECAWPRMSDFHVGDQLVFEDTSLD